jgi:hypothetical protein
VTSTLHPSQAPPPSAAPTRLAAHALNRHSQFGEDGIISEILSRMRAAGLLDPQEPIWAVEFGAWDGVHLSNARALVEEHQARAVFIEADAERFRSLHANYQHQDHVQCIRKMVTADGPNRLDVILAATPCPMTPTLLSIDIDGHDYHIWESLTDYRPRIVAIEYNPTIPTDAWYVQPTHDNSRRGSSLIALDGLAKKKGYRLAAVTEANAIFIEKHAAQRIGLPNQTPASLRPAGAPLTYLCQGFDGTCFPIGNDRLVWHDMPIDANRVQQIPKWLRHHTESYGHIQRAAIAVLRRWRARREQ